MLYSNSVQDSSCRHKDYFQNKLLKLDKMAPLFLKIVPENHENGIIVYVPSDDIDQK